MAELRFQRVLIKLSGEVFGGKNGFGFDHAVIDGLARQVHEVCKEQVKVGLMVGGGNIFRGARSAPVGMDRVVGDHMGMLATVMNALFLQDALERIGLETRVMSAIELKAIAETYIKRRMDHHLRMNRVVIFAAGTGNPFFTTDTAASLRASEMGADVLIKGTKVDGVYDKDPKIHPNAKRFERLTYNEVLQQDLNVMDSTAVAFCKDNKMPIMVVNIGTEGSLLHAVRDGVAGTLVS
ncbi:MAG: UMP kinase [Deltaproteobacteria bacterium]|nr:UMP kinase [Deltaproteobacteria bacterium]